MNIVLNCVIILLESLFYAMFFDNIKKSGKTLKLLLAFILMSAIGAFAGTDFLVSYFLLIIMMILGIKYIAGIKMNMYDLLVIFTMILIKHIIEIPLTLIVYTFIKNIYVVTTIVGVLKIGIVFAFRHKFYNIYSKIKIAWNNNNFYIRYIFTTFMLIYVIASCLYCIIKWM